MGELMNHQGGAAHADQDWPLHQSHRTDCTERQRGGGRRMTAPTYAVAHSVSDSLHTPDDATDSSAAHCAGSCRRRIGGLRHHTTGDLKNVHLFTSLGPDAKTMVYLCSPCVNRRAAGSAPPRVPVRAIGGCRWLQMPVT
jgi:hypothetical protein